MKDDYKNATQGDYSMSIVEKTFKSGEVIIKEGDIGKSFFRLMDGSALVYAGYGKNDQIKLSAIEPGEYFGEMAMIEAYPRSATVVAKGTVTVIEIPEDDINEYFEENPDMISDLMRYLSDRITATTNDLNEAEDLLKQLREADAGKKQSLFSKIKKHVNVYQSNKSKIGDNADDPFKGDFTGITYDDSNNVKNYRKGMIIYREGKPADCMYILHSGSVGFYTDYRSRDELKASELSAISLFGEAGLISEDARINTAVSEADDTVVEFITQDDLVPLFRSSPAKVVMILRYLSYSLRSCNNRFLSVCKEITESYGDQL